MFSASRFTLAFESLKRIIQRACIYYMHKYPKLNRLLVGVINSCVHTTKMRYSNKNFTIMIISAGVLHFCFNFSINNLLFINLNFSSNIMTKKSIMPIMYCMVIFCFNWRWVGLLNCSHCVMKNKYLNHQLSQSNNNNKCKKKMKNDIE